VKTGGAWDYDATGGGDLRVQNIITHTIGFGVGSGSSEENYLENIATKGTGNYYPASNASDLADAFAAILSDASTSIPYTYSSPTIPYNPDNSAVSDDFLYVPMFSPLANTYWKGNIKKYRVGIEANGDVFFKDRNGADVVNADFLFEPNTPDYWSSTANTGAAYYHSTQTLYVVAC
jgi:type IV pilus assembly protein PilY1